MILVIYDVADNKKRRRIVKLLESYGNRVQKSAFECDISQASVMEIERRALELIDVEEDSFRLYSMNSYNTLFSIGGPEQEKAKEYDVV